MFSIVNIYYSEENKRFASSLILIAIKITKKSKKVKIKMFSKPLICAISLSLLSTLSHSSSSSSSSPTTRHAIAIIHPQNKSECRGLASFSQESHESSTKILINVIGMEIKKIRILCGERK